MSREQLGSRMRSSRKPHTSRGISASAVQSIERQESSGAVTLDSLKRSAEAMGCSLVYALIPNRSLEDMVQQQAQLVADRLAKETRQTMKLEAQDYTAPLLDSGVIETLINSHILWNNHD
jgi:predicted DNA-binding mobile mystery protein A